MCMSMLLHLRRLPILWHGLIQDPRIFTCLNYSILISMSLVWLVWDLYFHKQIRPTHTQILKKWRPLLEQPEADCRDYACLSGADGNLVCSYRLLYKMTPFGCRRINLFSTVTSWNQADLALTMKVSGSHSLSTNRLSKPSVLLVWL